MLFNMFWKQRSEIVSFDREVEQEEEPRSFFLPELNYALEINPGKVYLHSKPMFEGSNPTPQKSTDLNIECSFLNLGTVSIMIWSSKRLPFGAW